MKRTVTAVLALLGAALLTLAAVGGEATPPAAQEPPQPTVEESTLTRVGQQAPDFTVATLDGGSFSLSGQRGKVVLVNWFATWCPPCIAEMPHLQKEVWEKFRGPGFAMVSIARAETLQVVQPFVAQRALTWTFALDPAREAYARYATAFIPRNQVISRTGEILFQSEGFEEEDFAEMIEVIAGELGQD